MKTVAALAGFFLTCGVAAVAHASMDEVDLVDGTVLQGRIVQQTPGSLVVIQTDDGRVQSVPWSQVKRVSAMAPAVVAPLAAPAPSPAAAAPPPAVITSDSTPDAPRATPFVPPTVHFELGARLGYMVGAGSYASGMQLTAASPSVGLGGTTGGFPIVADLGVRIGTHVFFGGFAQYGDMSTSCFSPGNLTVSCSAHDVRAGLELQLHAQPRGGIDPWAGFAIGHDWLTTKAAGSDSSSDVVQYTFDGWDLADLMVGVDFRSAGGLGVGPYFEFTSGSFGNVSGGTPGSSGSLSISSTASHQWFSVGVRGTFEAGVQAQAQRQ